MSTYPAGTIAVIFLSKRSGADEAGYAEAAARMEALAGKQPGFLGVDSVRGADGVGITVSYWQDEASAKSWRDHAEHAAIRAMGRAKWYGDYSLHVTKITRSYDWPAT